MVVVRFPGKHSSARVEVALSLVSSLSEDKLCGLAMGHEMSKMRLDQVVLFYQLRYTDALW
jgi:hypothetical protein